MRRPLIFTLAVAVGIGLDLASKALVFRAIAPGQSLPIWPGVLQFVRAENRGVAFSLLANHPQIIYLVTVFFIGLLIWHYLRQRHAAPQFSLFCHALLIAGAAGNLFDRIALGHVRDFIDFMPAIPLVGHWAIFNAADICITMGVLLCVLTGFRSKESSPEHAAQSAQKA